MTHSPRALIRAQRASQQTSALWAAAAVAVLASMFAGAFFVGAADPDEIEVQIFEDIVGDGLADGVVGDANNPGTSSQVALYLDDGTSPDVRDAADTFVTGVLTAPDGTVSFSGLDPSEDYWVVVMAAAISPSAGQSVVGDQWVAEQTYGPAGSVDPSGALTSVAGPLYGGQDPVGDDNANSLIEADHVALISPGADTALFGFSFNVVTNMEGTRQQGSFPQFVENADNISGPNYMRLVPMVPTNAGEALGNYWFTNPDDAVMSLRDPGTTIDGRPYHPDGTFRDEAPGNLSPTAGRSLGTRGATLPAVPKPQFQVYWSSFRLFEETGSLPTGTTFRNLNIVPRVATDVAINVDGTSGGVISGVSLYEVTFGTCSPVTTCTGPADRADYWFRASYAPNFSVENSYIGESNVRANNIFNSNGAVFRNNEFRGAGEDALRIDETSTGVVVEGNYFTGSNDYCLDSLSPGITVADNTFEQCGDGTNQTGGVRIATGAAVVNFNEFTGNNGPGLFVAGERDVPFRLAGRATVSANAFSGNNGLAIDLNAPATDQLSGDGISLNDGNDVDFSSGNFGVDYPIITGITPTGPNQYLVNGTSTCVFCTIEIYAAAGDASDLESGSGLLHGEGYGMFGSATSDASGAFSVPAFLDGSVSSISATATEATGTSEFGPNFAVTPPSNIGGRVLLDVNGDADLADASPVSGATVRFYQDVDGAGAAVGSGPALGDPLIGTATTAADGSWTFPSPSTGYWVTIDSKTVQPPALNGGSAANETWAEQTYGPAGSRRATYSGTTPGIEVTTANGPVVGGEEASVSDNAATLPGAEHVFFVPGASTATDFDTAFSFNVVVNASGGNGFDGDLSDPRTWQGTLRQFIQNANAVSGSNEMRFVPSAPPNAADAGTGALWWRSSVEQQLPTVVDADTTISGQEHDYNDPAVRLDSNRIDLAASRAVGVDGTIIREVDAPEFELWGNRAGNPNLNGLQIEAARSNVNNVAFLGFDTAIELGAGADDSTLERNTIGVENVGGGDPGTNNRNESAIYVTGASNVDINESLIGYSKFSGIFISAGATNVSIAESHLIGLAAENLTSGAILMMGTGPSMRITNNVISGANGFAIDATNTAGSSLFVGNSIENSGVGGVYEGGIRVSGTGSTVEKNVFGPTQGAPVVLVGSTPPAIGTRVSQNTYGPISNYQAPGIAGPAPAIDISRPGPNSNTGDGPDANTGVDGCGADEPMAGSEGLDYPDLTISQSNGNSVLSGTACVGATIEIYEATGSGGTPTIYRGSFVAAATSVNHTIGGGLGNSATHYTFTQYNNSGTSEFAPPVPANTINQDPTITNPGLQVIDENVPFTLAVIGDDPDDSDEAWTVSGPAGLTISPTGVISWTPDETTGGSSFSVTVTLTGGGVSVSEVFSIQVTEDNQPLTVVDPGPQTATEFVPFVLPMSFSDPDDPTGASIGIGLLSIPAGMTWDSGSREIRWTPGETHGGTTVSLTFRAVSGGQTVDVPLSIAVAEDDAQPTASITPTASTTEFVAIQITPTGSDPEGVPVTWSLLSGPVGVTVDGATGRVDWTPGELDGGTTATIRLAATDGTTTPVPVQVLVTVAEDDQPPMLDPIARLNALTGDPLTVGVSATDPDDPADSLTYSLADGADAVPPWMSINPSTGVVSFMAPAAGDTDVFVVASESDGPSATTPLGITVTDPVGPPATITAPGPQVISEGDIASVVFTATNATSYVVGSLPSGAVFDIATTTISWPTGELDGGTTQTFTVTAVGDGGSETAVATVQVDEVNQAPVAGPVGTVSVIAGNDVTIPISVTDADLPAQSFTWALLEGPAGLQLSNAGVVTWTNATVGTFLVRTMVFNPGFPGQPDFADFFVVVQAPPTTTTTTAPTTTTTVAPTTTTTPTTVSTSTSTTSTSTTSTLPPTTAAPTTAAPTTVAPTSEAPSTTLVPTTTPPTTAPPATPATTLPELPIDEQAIAPPAPIVERPIAEPFEGEISVFSGVPSLLSAPAAVQLPRQATVLSGAWILLLGVPLVMWERKRAVSVVSGAGATELVPVFSTRNGTHPIAHLRSDATMLWWRFRFMGLGEGQRVRVDSPLGRVWIDRDNLQPLHNQLEARRHGD